jgi:hypothetical protein
MPVTVPHSHKPEFFCTVLTAPMPPKSNIYDYRYLGSADLKQRVSPDGLPKEEHTLPHCRHPPCSHLHLQKFRWIKHKPKIEAIINNAKLFQTIIQEYGSIDAYFWAYVNNKTVINDVPDYKTAACTSPVSDALTKDLKKRGFKFVGSTTIYAFMQACGMVNDHENSCGCK